MCSFGQIQRMKTFFFYAILMLCLSSCVVDIIKELPFCTAETTARYAIFPMDSVLIPEEPRSPSDQITICEAPHHGHIRFHGTSQISYHPDIISGRDSLIVKLIRLSDNDTTIMESKQIMRIFENPESRCRLELFEVPQTLTKRIFAQGRNIPDTPFNPVFDPCFDFMKSISILQYPEEGIARVKYSSTEGSALIYSNQTPTSGTLEVIRYEICVDIDQEILCREFELKIQIM